MSIRYSKPSADVAGESFAYLEKDAEIAGRQRRLAAALNDCPQRESCIVCESPLRTAQHFKHRVTDYVVCGTCRHVQTRALPPAGYPRHTEEGVSFNQIYPPLDAAAFDSRRDRIYRPKLNWVLDCHAALGRSREELLRSRWTEIGSGAGYFLDALRICGAQNICGLEEDAELVRRANQKAGAEVAICYQDSLADSVARYQADIYAAFFVLEHVTDTRRFFAELGRRPSGTVFVFAVPVFGFAALLEAACTDYAARQLDSVVHTQLFTDASIKYCLDSAGYRIAAQWVFGQDSADLSRMMLAKIGRGYPPDFVNEARKNFAAIQDSLQQVIDRNFWADSRHIVAVKA